MYFNETLDVKNESVGYITETIKDEEPIQNGELVIIDTDLLFREEEFDENFLDQDINTDFYQMCEKRYQKEKNIRSNVVDKLSNKRGDLWKDNY